MATCLGCWFLPVVSGVVCSAVEAQLINKVLKIMGCHSEVASDKIYWFFRQKTFFLFGATYAPFVGVPLQLFETYGLGQFAIHCALRPELLTDEAWLEQSWKEVAPDIFSGDHAIRSYEQFTGKEFPGMARGKFFATVDTVNELYLLSQKIPGAAVTQEMLGKTAHNAIRAGTWLLKAAGWGAVGVAGAVAGVGRGIYDIVSGEAGTVGDIPCKEPEDKIVAACQAQKAAAKAIKKAAEKTAFNLAQARYRAAVAAMEAEKAAAKLAKTRKAAKTDWPAE
jgi:hypothetical protein